MKIKFEGFNKKDKRKIKGKIKKDVSDHQIESFKEIVGADSDKETYSYEGWLISDSFVKRALAVWGYLISAYVFIFGALFGLIVVAYIILELIGIVL